MVAACPHVSTAKMIGAIKANEEPRNTGIDRFVQSWKINVPKPAVNNATLGSRPVIKGTSTNEPNATNSICAPARSNRHPAREWLDI
jgi:hypothetical protein